MKQPVFLSIQATYAHAQIALFKRDTCVDHYVDQRLRASSHLIPSIESLLTKHNLQLADLDFIAIDKGPGAFTSLRVAIATVNGIAFAHQIPLIGIDGLDAFAGTIETRIQEKQLPPHPCIVVLLNAYNNDVYFAIATYNAQSQSYASIAKGCQKIDAVINMLQEQMLTGLIGTGNGFDQHLALIKQSLGATCHVHHAPQATPTACDIGNAAYKSFLQQKPAAYKVEPNYLKSQYFALAQHTQSTKRS